MDAHLDLLELDAARTGPRPAHLDACAACRATFDGLRSLEVSLAPTRVEVPPFLRARILKPRRSWTPLAAAAAIFVAVAALFLAPASTPDVVDAYLIASGLQKNDVNGDGVVDRRDAEALAREIVSVGGGAAR